MLDRPSRLSQGVLKDKTVRASPRGVVQVRAHTRTPEAGKRGGHRTCPFAMAQHKKCAKLDRLQLLAGQQSPKEPPRLDDSHGQDVSTPRNRQSGEDQLWHGTEGRAPHRCEIGCPLTCQTLIANMLLACAICNLTNT